MPKKPTKAEQARDEMARRQSLSEDLLMGYCEKDDLWFEWDKVWENGKCPTCGDKPSSRIGYQVTSSRTWNPFLSRTKIKNRQVKLEKP